jgi:Ni/Fe-hydrogenase subunit HybB-like protein
VVTGGLTACYTAWLFAQAKGRVLWMKRHLWVHLIVQATLAGSAFLALLSYGLDWEELDGVLPTLKSIMLTSLAAHLIFTLLEDRMAPKGREAEYHRASRLVTHGPWMKRHWLGAVLVGTLIPIVLLVLPFSFGLQLAAVLMLGGLWIAEDVFVRAAQALPIS